MLPKRNNPDAVETQAHEDRKGNKFSFYHWIILTACEQTPTLYQANLNFLRYTYLCNLSRFLLITRLN